jgi:hypothetical protein
MYMLLLSAKGVETAVAMLKLKATIDSSNTSGVQL